MAGILRNMKCDAVNVGGTADHIHIVCALSKFHAPVEILEAVKKDSSKWAKTLSNDLEGFAWQRGYGLFSVSPADFDVAKEYVANQEEHHRKMTFQEEFRMFLRKYRVPYDERYVWD
jgi:REP element-mobilizing transposase RayT